MGYCFSLNCLNFSGKNKKEVIRDKLRLEFTNNQTEEEWGESSDSIGVILKLESNADAGYNSSKHIAGGLRLGNLSTNTATEEAGIDPYVRIIQTCPEKTGIPEEVSDELTSFERGISAIQSPSLNLSPGVKQCQRALSKRSSTQTGYLTVPSDWGDIFDGLDSLEFARSESLIPQTFSTHESSVSSDQFTLRESRLSIVIPKQKKILLSPGEVIGIFISKKENLFQILNLNSSLDEVVDKFLFKATGVRLPVSFPKTETNLPKTISISKMGITLSESLGPQFDPNKQGLVFACGAVNSTFCYKISFCDLGIIETLFYIDPDKLSQG